MTQVTITLVGDPENVDRGIQGAPIEGDGIPYAQLPRTVLEVDEQTPLRVVLHNASALMGVDQSWTEHGPSWIAFYQHPDEAGYRPRREQSSVYLVDDEGRIRGRAWFKTDEVTLAEVARSATAGVLEGDPTRPYLILRPGYGNGILPDWSDWALIYLVLREVMEILSDAEGAAQGIRRSAAFIRGLFTRIRRVPEVLESNAEHWSEVGIHPHDLRLLIERQPRDTQTLARLLDVTADEVATLLEAQGFVQNEWSHLWEVDDTNEGATIRRIVKRVETVEWEHSTPERHEHLRHELTRIVEEETGPESE